MSITSKIKDLFDYRKLPWLAQRLGVEEAILIQMESLQYDIFSYDKLLEESWAVDHAALASRWALIEKKLKSFGFNDKEVNEELKQIRTYAVNEISTRDGQQLPDLPIRYFYYFKSCDVKLMRRILHSKSNLVEAEIRPSDWIIFDLVTEVNDDIADYYEDIGTFNGNRFLHSCLQRSTEFALNEYDEFLEYLSQRNTEFFESGRPSSAYIGKWTEEEIKNTRILLAQFKKISMMEESQQVEGQYSEGYGQ